MWILEIFSSIYFGYEITTLFTSHHWNFVMRIAAGIPIGIYSTSWVFLLLSLFLSLKFIHGLLITIFLIIISFWLHSINQKNHSSTKLKLIPLQAQTFLFAFLFLFLTMIFTFLFFGQYSIGATLSDLSFHLELISSIA